MADDTFHETQHDLARTLIRTFYEALSVQFDRKDHITKDELDRAFNLIEGFWPKTLPAFKANCRLCIDKNGSRAYNPDARRKDFLTRFVFSLLITTIPSRMDPGSGKYFPAGDRPGHPAEHRQPVQQRRIRDAEQSGSGDLRHHRHR